MCTYIGSDVVLANLLYYYPEAENGVDFSDIEEYCNQIKSAVIERGDGRTNFISFQVNDCQLEDSLRVYPSFFKRFVGKYYKGIDLDIGHFEKRVNPEMNTIMRSVAEAL